MRKVLACALLLPVVGTGEPAAFLDQAAAGIATLQQWYQWPTGLWKTTGWWNAANGITVLVRYSKLSGSAEYRPAIANTFHRNAHGSFLNEYYDDEGWWALAWAGAYDWSHDPRYLATAEKIFADMAGGWDNTCGGGIWWKKDRHYKNAIANELFLSTAAHLATLTTDSTQRANHLDWAKREWQWFAASGMINAQNLINDGLDSNCHNNGKTVWSYNQGVILGGLAALSKQTADAAVLDRAHSIATAAMAHLAGPDGIVHDPCEPDCGADGTQFKGIFARNLAALNSASPDPTFRAFLQTNANSIWRNQSPDHQVGVLWSAPSAQRNAATQISALDAILSAAEASQP